MIQKTMDKSIITRCQMGSPCFDKISKKEDYVILQLECDSTQKDAYINVEVISREDYEETK